MNTASRRLAMRGSMSLLSLHLLYHRNVDYPVWLDVVAVGGSGLIPRGSSRAGGSR
jgi:hypothetical protein